MNGYEMERLRGCVRSALASGTLRVAHAGVQAIAGGRCSQLLSHQKLEFRPVSWPDQDALVVEGNRGPVILWRPGHEGWEQDLKKAPSPNWGPSGPGTGPMYRGRWVSALVPPGWVSRTLATAREILGCDDAPWTEAALIRVSWQAEDVGGWWRVNDVAYRPIPALAWSPEAPEAAAQRHGRLQYWPSSRERIPGGDDGLSVVSSGAMLLNHELIVDPDVVPRDSRLMPIGARGGYWYWVLEIPDIWYLGGYHHPRTENEDPGVWVFRHLEPRGNYDID